jgi:hypothetical protein
MTSSATRDETIAGSRANNTRPPAQAANRRGIASPVAAGCLHGLARHSPVWLPKSMESTIARGCTLGLVAVQRGHVTRCAAPREGTPPARTQARSCRTR